MEKYSRQSEVQNKTPKSLDTDVGASAFSSTTDIEAGYKRIKDEIELLEAAVRSWKSRHNTLSIVARLPPEILTAVFKYVAAEIQNMTTTQDLNMRWVKLTHVCSHWRHVALRCPSLWTNIPISHPSWVEEMLKRSKMAPLTIVGVSDHRLSLARGRALETTLAQMSRIRELRLSKPLVYQSCDMEKILASKILASLVNPAPFLESLYLCFNHAHPIHLFLGPAPRLREIVLHRCSLTLDSPWLCGLTTLILQDPAPTLRQSTNQIFSALRNMPNLKTLELREVFPVATTRIAVNNDEDPVLLPHLSHLCINSDIIQGSYFLKHLVYPQTVSISLGFKVNPCHVNQDDLSLNLQSIRDLGKILSESQPPKCSYAECLFHSHVICLSIFDNFKVGTRSGVPEDKPRFELILSELEYAFHTNVFGDILNVLWISVPTKDVESLHIVSQVSEGTWSSIIDGFSTTNLRKLSVNSVSGIDLSEVLQSVGAYTPIGELSEYRIKIPFLRELAIEGWKFDEVIGGKTCFEILQNCLKTRRLHESGIDKLFLKGCRCITVEDVGKLREIVDVTWDGLQNLDEYEEDEYGEVEYEEDEYGEIEYDGYSDDEYKYESMSDISNGDFYLW